MYRVLEWDVNAYMEKVDLVGAWGYLTERVGG